MGTPSPKYTADFKQKTVELCKESGVTLDEFADMLDVCLKWYGDVRSKNRAMGTSWANN